MMVFLNGEFVPEDQAMVSVFDRGFLYGDALFETILVRGGKPFLWREHIGRLQHGAEYLRLALPLGPAELLSAAHRLIAVNGMPEALLRLAVSRGVGVRGYSPRGADRPTVVMSVHSAPVLKPDQPARWRLHVASCRLPANEVLAQFKTANKLPQILARAEAEAAGADEALLLNTDGHVVEGAASNLFWIERARVCTPPLASGVLAGVTRAVVAELCRQLRVPFGEATIELEALFRAQAVFLSLSSYGIVEAESINGRLVGGSPITKLLQSAYQGLLEDFAACAG